jgi:hypothetical protein
MSLEIKGTVYSIGNTTRVTDKFSKRELVLKVTNNQFTNYAIMQCINTKCSLLDNIRVGQEVTAFFEVQGKEPVNGKAYPSTLAVWKIQ